MRTRATIARTERTNQQPEDRHHRVPLRGGRSASDLLGLIDQHHGMPSRIGYFRRHFADGRPRSR
jgi:hypothetical protein